MSSPVRFVFALARPQTMGGEGLETPKATPATKAW